MQIILNQQEVEDAIRDAVLQQITIREDQGIAVAFEGVSRDGNLTVSVTIQKIGDDVATPKKTRTKKPIQIEESIPEPAKAHIIPEEIAVPPQAAEPVIPAPVQAPKIFPDINTSAPVATPPAATPAAGPRSLFANLTKPVHDQKGE